MSVTIIGLAAVYFVTGKLGALLAIPPGYATAIWPSSGIALAAILLLGYRAWPGILLGSFLVNLSTTFDASTSTTTYLSIALPAVIGGGAALQGVVGAFLVRRYADYPNPLASEKEVFAFLFYGGMVGGLVNATVGVTALLLTGRLAAASVLHNWGTWWAGDAIGVFIFTPLVLTWAARPAAQWRERRMVLTVPVVVTIIVAVVTVTYSTRWEQERLRLNFNQYSDSLESGLDKALTGYMGVLESLESFHAASVHIDRDEFKAFTKQYLKNFPNLQALSWNPRIQSGDKAAFEEATKKEGFPKFQIMERNSEGSLVRAADRPEFVVVQYIEPFKGNEAAFGFDVYSNPTRREALDKARDTGEPVATGRIKLVQEKEQQAGVLVFLPIYRNGLPHETIEDRRRNLQGYMVGVLRMGDVMEAFMQKQEMEGIVHRLLDWTAESSEQLLYECEHARRHGGGFILVEKGLFGGATQLKREIHVPFGQRKWVFTIEAGQEFFVRHRTEQAWLFLFTGLLLTSLIVAFVLVVSGRGGMLRRLVAERTAALQESEDRLVAAQKIAKVGNWDWDIVNNRLTWSDEIYRIFGLEPQAFSGTYEAFLERVHPDDRQSVETSVNLALQEGQSYAIDHRIVMPAGLEKVVHERAEVLFGEDGKPLRMFGTVHDITDRKRTEIKLQQAGNELNVILQSAGEGIYGADPEGRVIFANAAAARMLGWETDELIGQTSHETFHHTRHDATVYPAEECPIYRTARDGETRVVDDDMFWRKDGTGFPVQYTASPRREAGRIVGVVVAFEDITSRKEAERELLKLSTAVTQSPVSVLITDSQGSIQYVNPKFTEVTGYGLDEVIGKNPRVLQSGETPLEQYTEMWATILSGNIWHGEILNKRKDGRLYWEAASIAPLRNRNGEITNFVAVKEDITNRKRIEASLAERTEELQRSNTELKQFSYAVSHDLQEPLRGIISFLSLLEMRYKGKVLDGTAEEYIDFAVDGAKRMSNMIRDLLEFSRVQTRPGEPEPVDINEIVQKAIDNLATAIAENGVKITVAKDLPTVMGDPSQLTRVFQNLIGNGIKYSDPSRFPEVSVTAEVAGNKRVFSVTDNGIGVEPQYFNRIFEIFQRLHNRDKYVGTGVGLALVKRIVEQHGGRIWVESEPGVGSTFFFTLPAV